MEKNWIPYPDETVVHPNTVLFVHFDHREYCYCYCF